MKLPRISTFPIDRPFERQDSGTPLAEVVFRIVADFYSDEPEVLGTATALTGSVLISARHILGIAPGAADASSEGIDFERSIVAIQVLPGPHYAIWDIVDAIADPISDLVLLRLSAAPARSSPAAAHQWRQPRVNPFPPEQGDRIAAFGYRNSVMEVTTNADGARHVDLMDEPMVSVGEVREIFEMQRDNSFLPFPCYQTSARFDSGMSGGAVFDETGSLCGIVCAGTQGAHEFGEPISYVATLWPLFRLIINWDRGGNYPPGIAYSAIELARAGIVSVTDLERLESWFSRFA